MSRKANFNIQRMTGSDYRVIEDGLRRVSFQNNQGRIGRKQKNWNNHRNAHFNDDDVEMMDRDGRRRIRFVASDRGRNRNNRGNFAGRFMSDAVTAMRRNKHWFQIRIVCGARYNRDDILTRLQQYLRNQTFHPVCYQIMGVDTVFYVERFQTAQLILSCTRKVTFNDGQPIVIKIREARPSPPPIDDVLLSKMKSAMVRRFVSDNKALDLSHFVRDPEFLDGLYVSLSRGSIFAAAMKIISENIPDLVALNLSGNALHEFDVITPHVKNLKQLRILYLGENNITHLNSLNCFKELEIAELVLESNPVVNNFSDKTHFVSEVRKRFPKLTKLDNTELTPIVTFDVGDDTKFPTPQAAFVANAEGRGFVKAFLSQYFQIFDSENRSELAQAYADNASLSLVANYNPSSQGSGPRLNVYFNDSRNLLRINDFPRRKNRLFNGKSKIVEYLSKLPKTQHDLMSFAVDLPFFSRDLISLSVSGIFRETGTGSSAHWPCRYFSRTYLIVPMGAGFCIVNEAIFITNATDDQIAVAFKAAPAVVASPSALPPTVPSPSAALDDAMKLKMVQMVADQTGMNLDWSKKCLDETEWSFERAVWTFGELQKQGAIPAEAFIK